MPLRGTFADRFRSCEGALLVRLLVHPPAAPSDSYASPRSDGKAATPGPSLADEESSAALHDLHLSHTAMHHGCGRRPITQ
ncbi:unnamed protein product [Heligmosomoides polygyrus]|uniref:Secreted protein n=1 Tax=Heligmosomoides polygyrus TaxID=6339 RepID=A0A183FA82_HELPZ|nr:unnamed protein product [Heligmosomoides polygyrus]